MLYPVLRFAEAENAGLLRRRLDSARTLRELWTDPVDEFPTNESAPAGGSVVNNEVVNESDLHNSSLRTNLSPANCTLASRTARWCYYELGATAERVIHRT